LYSVFIDGMDGTGKSTLAKHLCNALEDQHSDQEITHFKFPTKEPYHIGKLRGHHFYLQDFFETMHTHKGYDDIRIFDRSFITTMVYQGFTGSHFPVMPTINQIMAMGPEYLLTSGHVDDRNSRDIFFLHVTCAVDVAIRRINERQNVAWVDDLDGAPDDQKLKQLEILRKRLSLCYPYVELNIPSMFPKHRYHFFEIDSTYLTPQEVLDIALRTIDDALNPRQQTLHLKNNNTA